MFGFGCKKDEKCVIGKWYHVRSVCNGIIQNENQEYAIIITENSFTNNNTNETINNIVITDELIGDIQYSCNGNNLKLKYNYCISDNMGNDRSFDKNYIEFKR